MTMPMRSPPPWPGPGSRSPGLSTRVSTPGRRRAAGSPECRFIPATAWSGRRAAPRCGFGAGEPPALPEVEDSADSAPAPLSIALPPNGALRGARRAFVDLHNDVTAADIALAAREGYAAIEHAKRYTTLGMGTD